jgi:hypothetical protein
LALLCDAANHPENLNRFDHSGTRQERFWRAPLGVDVHFSSTAKPSWDAAISAGVREKRGAGAGCATPS